MSRCVTPESWPGIQNDFSGNRRRILDENLVSVEIVARRQLNATTVQLGVQLHTIDNPRYDQKIILTLVLQGGEWRVDLKHSKGA